MLALYRSGRQSEAVAAAAELKRLLADELGLDASPQVRELEQRILRQEPGLTAPHALRREPEGSTARRTTQRMASSSSGLDQKLSVGRAGALALFDQVVSDATAGRGRILVLDAPAGYGKSTMLDALAARFRAVDGIVVRGVGVGAGAMPALWPWVSVARQLADMEPPLAMAFGTRGALAPLLGLTEPDATPNEMAESDRDLARTRLYRAVVDLLASARHRHPLAVLFDDAHWVDADTLTLLSLAAEELADQGVVFAVAARTDQPGVVGVAERIEVARADRLTNVVLSEFTDTEVAELVHGLSGVDAEPGLAAAIRTRTAGNPLFVTELVRLLGSEHRLDYEGVQSSLPTRVREVLRRRIDRLPEQTVALLTVAAVVRRPADVSLLSEVTGLDVDTVLDACESALLVGLLVEDVGGPGTVRLSHDLVRQTLEESLSQARSLRLHARVAAAIEAGGVRSAEHIAELASHLTIASPVVGPAAAVPYLIAASDDALSRFANDLAEQNLRTALRLAEEIGDATERVALEGPVRGRLALLGSNLHGVTDLSGGQDEALLTAPPPMDFEATAGWLGVVVSASISGQYRSAVDAAERALGLALPPIGEAAARFVLAFSSGLLGRFDVAKTQFDALEGLFAAGTDTRIPGLFSIPVSSQSIQALLAQVRGDHREADAHLASARDRSGQADVDLVVVEQTSSWVAAMRGDPVEAQASARACVEIAERLGYPIYVFSGGLIDAWAAVAQGDRSYLPDVDAQCAAIGATGLQMLMPFYLLLCAEAHNAAGDDDLARDFVRRSRAVSAGGGDVLLGPRLTALSQVLVPIS
jgi:hypothetical protein